MKAQNRQHIPKLLNFLENKYWFRVHILIFNNNNQECAIFREKHFNLVISFTNYKFLWASYAQRHQSSTYM